MHYGCIIRTEKTRGTYSTTRPSDIQIWTSIEIHMNTVECCMGWLLVHHFYYSYDCAIICVYSWCFDTYSTAFVNSYVSTHLPKRLPRWILGREYEEKMYTVNPRHCSLIQRPLAIGKLEFLSKSLISNALFVQSPLAWCDSGTHAVEMSPCPCPCPCHWPCSSVLFLCPVSLSLSLCSSFCFPISVHVPLSLSLSLSLWPWKKIAAHLHGWESQNYLRKQKFYYLKLPWPKLKRK